eukprot:Clim_evm47s11 gene=Clim_evmTU47s11
MPGVAEEDASLSQGQSLGQEIMDLYSKISHVFSDRGLEYGAGMEIVKSRQVQRLAVHSMLSSRMLSMELACALTGEPQLTIVLFDRGSDRLQQMLHKAGEVDFEVNGRICNVKNCVEIFTGPLDPGLGGLDWCKILTWGKHRKLRPMVLFAPLACMSNSHFLNAVMYHKHHMKRFVLFSDWLYSKGFGSLAPRSLQGKVTICCVGDQHTVSHLFGWKIGTFSTLDLDTLSGNEANVDIGPITYHYPHLAVWKLKCLVEEVRKAALLTPTRKVAVLCPKVGDIKTHLFGKLDSKLQDLVMISNSKEEVKRSSAGTLIIYEGGTLNHPKELINCIYHMRLSSSESRREINVVVIHWNGDWHIEFKRLCARYESIWKGFMQLGDMFVSGVEAGKLLAGDVHESPLNLWFQYAIDKHLIGPAMPFYGLYYEKMKITTKTGAHRSKKAKIQSSSHSVRTQLLTHDLQTMWNASEIAGQVDTRVILPGKIGTAITQTGRPLKVGWHVQFGTHHEMYLNPSLTHEAALLIGCAKQLGMVHLDYDAHASKAYHIKIINQESWKAFKEDCGEHLRKYITEHIDSLEQNMRRKYSLLCDPVTLHQLLDDVNDRSKFRETSICRICRSKLHQNSDRPFSFDAPTQRPRDYQFQYGIGSS